MESNLTWFALVQQPNRPTDQLATNKLWDHKFHFIAIVCILSRIVARFLARTGQPGSLGITIKLRSEVEWKWWSYIHTYKYTHKTLKHNPVTIYNKYICTQKVYRCNYRINSIKIRFISVNYAISKRCIIAGQHCWLAVWSSSARRHDINSFWITSCHKSLRKILISLSHTQPYTIHKLFLISKQSHSSFSLSMGH